MASKRTVQSILGQLKQTGNVVGSHPAIPTLKADVPSEQGQQVKPRVLEVRSYNPLLTKVDFLQLLPQTRFSTTKVSESTIDFEVLKVRDSRYFQFKDKYRLIFPNYKTLNAYSKYISYSRLDGAKPDFAPSRSQRAEVSYGLYARNLSAAYKSSEDFFQTVRLKDESTLPKMSIENIRSVVGPLQKKSLLVWNFPSDLRPYHIMDRFWFYDIKHCFKLYWDPSTGRNLTYMAFNSSADCTRFRRNFHGIYYNENDECKLLVESLA